MLRGSVGGDNPSSDANRMCMGPPSTVCALRPESTPMLYSMEDPHHPAYLTHPFSNPSLQHFTMHQPFPVHMLWTSRASDTQCSASHPHVLSLDPFPSSCQAGTSHSPLAGKA